MAHHWWPPNDKPTFAVGVAAVAAASFFAALQYRLNRAQGIPILTLHQGNNIVEIENIGKGAALNTCFTDSRGVVLHFIGSVAAGERRPVSLNVHFDINSKHRLYYHDTQLGLIRRRMWRRSTVFSRAFGPGHHPAFVNDFASKVYLVPPDVRRETSTRTLFEHLQQLTAWYDPRNWWHRFVYEVRPRYRNAIRAWYVWRERDRVAYFAEEIGNMPAADVTDTVRADWPIDISGLMNCPSSPGMCHQRRYTEQDGSALLLVAVGPRIMDDGRLGQVRGIVVVTADVLARLPEDRNDRNDVIWQRFRDYYCRYRPRGRFAFRLNRL